MSLSPEERKFHDDMYEKLTQGHTKKLLQKPFTGHLLCYQNQLVIAKFSNRSTQSVLMHLKSATNVLRI
ncbi:hypothetical protein AXW85_07470 [Pseudomonas aeruginosa]|nr:hypothetical protein AXW85_07470 [Pseudomonas aeruginosa]